MFIGWILQEPQLLVWLSTLNRMRLAEMGRFLLLFFLIKVQEQCQFQNSELILPATFISVKVMKLMHIHLHMWVKYCTSHK
jgi:hypothetical protein